MPLFFICDKMCVYQCDKGGTLNTCEERLRKRETVGQNMLLNTIEQKFGLLLLGYFFETINS